MQKNEINFNTINKNIGIIEKGVKDKIYKNSISLNVNELSTFYLTYVGDALFELWSRQKILQRFQNRKLVHNLVVNMVRCQTQSRISTIILPFLTPKEKKIYSQGRNSKIYSIPKHATVKEYRRAS